MNIVLGLAAVKQNEFPVQTRKEQRSEGDTNGAIGCRAQYLRSGGHGGGINLPVQMGRKGMLRATSFQSQKSRARGVCPSEKVFVEVSRECSSRGERTLEVGRPHVVWLDSGDGPPWSCRFMLVPCLRVTAITVVPWCRSLSRRVKKTSASWQQVTLFFFDLLLSLSVSPGPWVIRPNGRLQSRGVILGSPHPWYFFCGWEYTEHGQHSVVK